MLTGRGRRTIDHEVRARLPSSDIGERTGGISPTISLRPQGGRSMPQAPRTSIRVMLLKNMRELTPRATAIFVAQVMAINTVDRCQMLGDAPIAGRQYRGKPSCRRPSMTYDAARSYLDRPQRCHQRSASAAHRLAARTRHDYSTFASPPHEKPFQPQDQRHATSRRHAERRHLSSCVIQSSLFHFI